MARNKQLIVTMKNVFSIILLFILLISTSFGQSFMNDDYQNQMIDLIKAYEKAINIEGNPKLSEKDKNKNVKEFLTKIVSPRIWVYNDLDSVQTDTSFVRLPTYFKSISTKYPHGVTARINFKKLKIDSIKVEKSRNIYASKILALKMYEYIEVTETKKDSVFLDTNIKDKEVYDTIEVVSYDTLKKKEVHKQAFYISCKKDKFSDKMSEFQIYAISKIKVRPRYLPLNNLFQYWVDLPELWKKKINEQLNLGDVPSKYRLGFLPGMEKLDLSGEKVKSLAPLSRLTGLKYLNLSNTTVKDYDEIGKLTGLRELYLNKTQTDTIYGFEKLTKLEVLHLQENEIADLSTLINCVNLKELDFSKNKVDTIDAIKNMVNLELLYFNHNIVTDISALKNLALLEEVEFRKNQVESIDALSGKYSLIKLDCFNNPIPSLVPIQNCKKLTLLNIGYTKIKSLKEIHGFVFLQDLNIVGTSADDYSFLSRFSYLKHFNCTNTSINTVNPIMGLKYLQSFKAVSTDIPKNDIQRFKKKHPRCQITYY